MRVVELRAENYKRLRAVEIRPDGNVVTIGGKNGHGKSSVLDAIYVALKGRAVNPPRPVRAGEEKATIRLDLGDLVVTRTFTVKEGKPYTDTLKVENADGFRASNPQATLDALLGEIGFDPFEFAQKDPKKQAATILEMVPLSVDLDDLAEKDKSDFANRRDVNRDVESLAAQVAGIPKEEVPEQAPDREALTDALARAGETNTGIERERAAREARRTRIDGATTTRDAKQAEAVRLRAEAERLEAEATRVDAEADELTGKIEAADLELSQLPALPESVDASALRADLAAAEAVLARISRQRQRAALEKRLEEERGKSQAFTDAMAARKAARTAALAKAPMPVEGLGIDVDAAGAPFLTWEGLPFDKDQISTAAQLRVSAAIGMAANPQLRVLRIKDGSLLDEDSMAMLAGMAETEDFQLWVEVVGTGGVGVIMEDGAVRLPRIDADAVADDVRAAAEAGEQPQADDAPTVADQEDPVPGHAGTNPPKSKKAKAAPVAEKLL